MKKEYEMQDEIIVNGVEYVRKDSIDKVDNSSLPCVIVRSYGAGVFYGYLVEQKAELNGVNVVIANARRIYYWEGACSLTQLAIEGTKSDNCKITDPIKSQFIANTIEILPMTTLAKKSLDKKTSWKK